MPNAYSTDLSPSQWQVIHPLIQVQRQSKWALKHIVEAVLYLTKNATTWRDLPQGFPPWQTVYWYFRKWLNDGTIERIATELTLLHRVAQGYLPLPTQVIIDAQSVRSAETAGQQVGYDGYKRIKGRQRLIAVDELGNLLWVKVLAANHHEGTSAARYWPSALVAHPLLEQVRTIYGDASFGGHFAQLAAQTGQQVVVPAHPIAKANESLLTAKRWVVERNFAWLGKYRRLAKDYERHVRTSEGFIWLVHIRRTLKWSIH